MKMNNKRTLIALCLMPLGFLAGCGSGSGSTSIPPVVTSTPPTITQQPANQTVNAGATATFTAAAGGTPAPTVQWQVSANAAAFANVPGATSPTLTITGTTASQNGNKYQAVFTNSAGSATTTPATLTVDFTPQITQQPTNQTVNAGVTATFTAAASGNPAPTVQWQVSVSGGAFTNVAGATSTTLTLTGTTASQNGNQYEAVFTNSVSSATTTAASLTVSSPPAVGGAAFDGPVVGATINAYSISSTGVVGTTPIASTITKADGSYALTLPSGFSGPVLITSLGGTYTDDVTGQTVQAGPLSVLVPDGSGTVTAELTPLTSMVAQLALQLAADTGTSPGPIATNLYTDLGTQFGGLLNIMSTPLVDVTSANCATGASQATLDMSLAVAGLAQLAAQNGVSSANLTAALIEDYSSDGTLDGDDNRRPIAVPLANGSGYVRLCTIEGVCGGTNTTLPQTLATAITAFGKSAANACGAAISPTTMANLNNPATTASLPPPPGAELVMVTGTVTGLNPNQSAFLHVATTGLPNHCVVTSGPGCPGVGFAFSGNGPFIGMAGAPFSGFTGWILFVTVSDPQNESCGLTAPFSRLGSVTPNAPVPINGIPISCGIVTYPVSVWVSGLASGQTLQLQNSGVDTLTVSTNQLSSFSTQLTYGSAYDVTILTQPSGETCAVQGTGMGTVSLYATVYVNCGTGTTSVLSNPNGVVLSSDQSKLYLANAGGNQVLVYNIARNPATGAATGMILVETITADIANPSRVAFDPTGEFLYVANGGPSGSKGWITVYDTANNNAEVTADKISTGSISRPLGVTVDANGNVYVADNASNAISVYQPNSSGGFVEASFSPLSGDAAGGQFFAPGALLFYSLSGVGDFLVVGTGGGNVFVYLAPLTNTSTPLFTLSRTACTSAPAGPTAFALFSGLFGGPPSSFFVSDYYGRDVLDYDINSFFSGNACPTGITQTPSGSNNGPEGVAVDVFGNVFVTNAGANSMFVYPNAGLSAAPTLTVQ